ncbi:MAG TPA: hypothetical protein VMH03_22345 [Terriglobales bacterium]|nr:hypothetical protein [Terriglobales bacterium]
MKSKLAPPDTGHESDLRHEMMDFMPLTQQTVACGITVDRSLWRLAESWPGVEP